MEEGEVRSGLEWVRGSRRGLELAGKGQEWFRVGGRDRRGLEWVRKR